MRASRFLFLFLVVVALFVGLAGCKTLEALKLDLQGGQSPTAPGGKYAGKMHLRETELAGIFSNLTTEDPWPRVAVSIDELPDWFYDTGSGGYSKQGNYGPNDCAVISAVLWTNSKTSKRFDGLLVCGDDMPRNISFKNIGIVWNNFAYADPSDKKHTGGKRTFGPNPPYTLYPNDPASEEFFTLHGNYYLGTIMYTLGYNWNASSDRTFWVVRVPTP